MGEGELIHKDNRSEFLTVRPKKSVLTTALANVLHSDWILAWHSQQTASKHDRNPIITTSKVQCRNKAVLVVCGVGRG